MAGWWRSWSGCLRGVPVLPPCAAYPASCALVLMLFSSVPATCSVASVVHQEAHLLSPPGLVAAPAAGAALTCRVRRWPAPSCPAGATRMGSTSRRWASRSSRGGWTSWREPSPRAQVRAAHIVAPPGCLPCLRSRCCVAAGAACCSGRRCCCSSAVAKCRTMQPFWEHTGCLLPARPIRSAARK